MKFPSSSKRSGRPPSSPPSYRQHRATAAVRSRDAREHELGGGGGAFLDTPEKDYRYSEESSDHSVFSSDADRGSPALSSSTRKSASTIGTSPTMSSASSSFYSAAEENGGSRSSSSSFYNTALRMNGNEENGKFTFTSSFDPFASEGCDEEFEVTVGSSPSVASSSCSSWDATNHAADEGSSYRRGGADVNLFRRSETSPGAQEVRGIRLDGILKTSRCTKEEDAATYSSATIKHSNTMESTPPPSSTASDSNVGESGHSPPLRQSSAVRQSPSTHKQQNGRRRRRGKALKKALNCLVGTNVHPYDDDDNCDDLEGDTDIEDTDVEDFLQDNASSPRASPQLKRDGETQSKTRTIIERKNASDTTSSRSSCFSALMGSNSNRNFDDEWENMKNETTTTSNQASSSCFSALMGTNGLPTTPRRRQQRSRRIVPSTSFAVLPPVLRGCATSLLGGTAPNEMEYLLRAARTSASKGRYAKAIQQYTSALQLHSLEHRNSSRDGRNDDKQSKLRSLLLANRAELLITVGAFEAAAHDCRNSLQLLSSCSGRDASDSYATTAELSGEIGPSLQPRTLALLGEALLRHGKLDEAANAFNESIDTAKRAMKQSNQSRTMRHDDGVMTSNDANDVEYLEHVSMSAMSGLAETQRCQDATYRIVDIDRLIDLNDIYHNTSKPHTLERETLVKQLANVDVALNVSFGDMALHQKRIALLVELQQWREVVDHCELLASTQVNLDGVFTTGDLVGLNPYPGVAPAKYLEETFFESLDEYELDELDTEAVKEAVLRLPEGIIPVYLQGLRLEERFDHAQAGIEAIQAHQWSNKLIRYPWLSEEITRLNQTISFKNQGDELLRRGKYERAARFFTSCLSIDGKVHKSNGSNGQMAATVGGRLNAILHCSRAACFISMQDYNASIADCTAALCIQPLYMTAILLRCRCYALLKLHDKAIAQYKYWLKLVKDANENDRSGADLDGPANISAEEMRRVEQELKRVVNTKHTQDRLYGASRNGYAQKGSLDASPNYYNILRVSTIATQSEIKKAYRKMALQHHPDKNQDPTAVDLFRTISEAYGVLSDEQARRRYDKELQNARLYNM